jgi:peptidoglycan-associated lipoprotein
MRKGTTIALLLTAGLILGATGCAKKQTVQQQPPTVQEPKEQPKEIPVVEEPVKQEPVKPERQYPVLEDVFFDFDKYNLREDAIVSLEKNAEELKKFPEVRILIEGHCDERGTEDYNLALGEKRAKAARDYLVNLGIDPSRIEIISYGESRPFDPGHNEEAWAKNRRAHFVIKK